MKTPQCWHTSLPVTNSITTELMESQFRPLGGGGIKSKLPGCPSHQCYKGPKWLWVGVPVDDLPTGPKLKELAHPGRPWSSVDNLHNMAAPLGMNFPWMTYHTNNPIVLTRTFFFSILYARILHQESNTRLESFDMSPMALCFLRGCLGVGR